MSENPIHPTLELLGRDSQTENETRTELLEGIPMKSTAIQSIRSTRNPRQKSQEIIL